MNAPHFCVTRVPGPTDWLPIKRGFQPRKERNEMTSLFDRPITAASDRGVCRWHAAKLWRTRAKLSRLNLICIISCTTSENVLKFGLLILKKLNLKNLSSAGKRISRFLLAGSCVCYASCVYCVYCVVCVVYVVYVCVRCVGWKPGFRLRPGCSSGLSTLVRQFPLIYTL